MTIEGLRKKANEVRKDLIEMLLNAGSGHSAGSLGQADIFTALYFEILNHDPKNPGWEERDRLFLSCGHTVPVRYVAMAHAGYFPRSELKTLRNQVSTKVSYLYGDKEKVEEPQYDVKLVDVKIAEIEAFLFNVDSKVKQSNAVTKIDLDVKVEDLLQPLQ